MEYAFNTSATTASDPTSFGYGPSGVLIQAFAPAGTSAINKRVRFQTPIQSGDALLLEASRDGGSTWVPFETNSAIGGVYSRNDAGTTAYGYLLSKINSTDVDVAFFSAPVPGVAWNSDATLRWRLRKQSAGAAVGFGIVSSGQAGLLPASNSNLDDATATRLGLKRYLHGTTYNSGIAPTVTSNRAGLTVSRAVFIPYQVQDGTWRLKFNIRATFTTVTADVVLLYANGVVFSSVLENQPFSAILGGVGVPPRTFTGAGTDELRTDLTSSASLSNITVCGEVELQSKPTWAY